MSALTIWDDEPLQSFDVIHQTNDHIQPLHVPLDRSLPSTLKEATKHPHSQRWHAAIQKELILLQENDTWDLVELPPGRKAFPNKWVFSYIVGRKVTEELERR